MTSRCLFVVAALGVALMGCRETPPCVPDPTDSDESRPVRRYDEFTQVTTVSSHFRMTPDQEEEARQLRHDLNVVWSVGLWFGARSNAALIDVRIQPQCLQTNEGDEQESCVNCDNLCNAQSATLEVVADGKPVALPPGGYQRLQIAPPDGESPATWASLISLSATPEALWPMAYAQQVKLRVCRSLVVTLHADELANLQDFLRHSQAVMPAPPPPAVPPPAPPHSASPPPAVPPPAPPP
jgi:hypothetical protein